MEKVVPFLVRIPVILLALTVHECAHAYIAWRRGDATAKNAGRLTLNPIAHLDIFGTLMLFFGPFGWAKPVPVNPYKFRNPRQDNILVSAAGPVSNMIVALVSGFLLRLLLKTNIGLRSGDFIIMFLNLSILINLGISFFNLLPVPPLDGSHILMGFLSPAKAKTYMQWMQYAPMVLFGLLMIDWLTPLRIFSTIINPLWHPYLDFWLWIIFGHAIL